MVSLLLKEMARAREPISGYSHLAGAVGAALGLVYAVLPAIGTRPNLHVLAFGIFVFTMMLVFLASALYHLLPLSEQGVAFLRRIDHSMIYIFIAGTYTPVCLIALFNGTGITMLAVIWTLTVIGVLLKIFWMESSRWLRTTLYVGMGVASIFILPALWRALPLEAFAGLIGGAMIYLAGALVYAFKRPNPLPNIFGFHEIWHLFVLAGSSCHFWTIRTYLLT